MHGWFLYHLKLMVTDIINRLFQINITKLWKFRNIASQEHGTHTIIPIPQCMLYIIQLMWTSQFGDWVWYYELPCLQCWRYYQKGSIWKGIGSHNCSCEPTSSFSLNTVIRFTHLFYSNWSICVYISVNLYTAKLLFYQSPTRHSHYTDWSTVTADNCRQHCDHMYTAIGSSVTMLLAVSSHYTVTVQSMCSDCA